MKFLSIGFFAIVTLFGSATAIADPGTLEKTGDIGRIACIPTRTTLDSPPNCSEIDATSFSAKKYPLRPDH